MLLPHLGSNQKQSAARLENSKKFFQCFSRFPQVLQDLDAKNNPKGTFSKGEFLDVGRNINWAVSSPAMLL